MVNKMKSPIIIIKLLLLILLLNSCEDSLGIEDNVNITPIGKQIDESSMSHSENQRPADPIRADSIKLAVEEKVVFWQQGREQTLRLIWYDFLRENDAILHKTNTFDKLSLDLSLYKNSLDSIGLFFPEEILQISLNIDTLDIFQGQAINLINHQQKTNQWLFVKTISIINERFDYYGYQIDGKLKIDAVYTYSTHKQIDVIITAKVPTHYRINYGNPPPLELKINASIYFTL